MLTEIFPLLFLAKLILFRGSGWIVVFVSLDLCIVHLFIQSSGVEESSWERLTNLPKVVNCRARAAQPASFPKSCFKAAWGKLVSWRW